MKLSDEFRRLFEKYKGEAEVATDTKDKYVCAGKRETYLHCYYLAKDKEDGELIDLPEMFQEMFEKFEREARQETGVIGKFFCAGRREGYREAYLLTKKMEGEIEIETAKHG